MKLSTRSEYACLALVDLSERFDEGFDKMADVAARKDLPKKYLEQILLILKRSRYVKSRRGTEGGYRLAKPPGEITLAEIVRLMDGALAPVESVSRYFYESTSIEQCGPLLEVMRDIRDYASQKLEETTFADLVKR